jgi:hypothetical protein
MQNQPRAGRAKLRLEAIEVESFETLPAEAERGTVIAQQSGSGTYCQTCPDCGQSYGLPCDTLQWQETCYTCYMTCGYACQSYEGYASCGGSCDHTHCPDQGCTAYCGESM